MTELADYDSTHYDYTKYWQGRRYENEVEQLAIKKLLPPTGNSLVDFGGGFGRNLKNYIDQYQYITLLDYSQENLNKAGDIFGPKVTLIKGDIYHLPFKDSSFDAGMMIRVMHHLEEPKKALSEVHRVMKQGSVFILEFANKIHFKARLKKGSDYAKDTTPYSQLTSNSGVFLNFHPADIEKTVVELGFKIEAKLSVSNFRSTLLKKLIPEKALIKLDDLTQKPLTRLNFGPSIFLKLVKN